MPSHHHFDYFFSDTEGITLGSPITYFYDYDLAIYYGSDLNTNFIDCRCSRWDVQNYSIIVETWIKKSSIQNLRNNIVPGAVGELYTILGKPLYYDQTWEGNNTIRLYPTPSSNYMDNSTLKEMRRDTIVYVKNYTEHPIPNTDWVEIKIEALISGSQQV